MKAKEVIKLLKDDGWQHIDTSGSHYQFTHAIKPGKVTVPFHGSRDLNKRLVHSIFKQAGWK